MAYINEKILRKLNEANTSKEIIKFLREILDFELQHFEEEHPRYKDEYERLARRYSEPGGREK